MYCIVTVVRFVISLIKFYVCMYVRDRQTDVRRASIIRGGGITMNNF